MGHQALLGLAVLLAMSDRSWRGRPRLSETRRRLIRRLWLVAIVTGMLGIGFAVAMGVRTLSLRALPLPARIEEYIAAGAIFAAEVVRAGAPREVPPRGSLWIGFLGAAQVLAALGALLLLGVDLAALTVRPSFDRALVDLALTIAWHVVSIAAGFRLAWRRPWARQWILASAVVQLVLFGATPVLRGTSFIEWMLDLAAAWSTATVPDALPYVPLAVGILALVVLTRRSVAAQFRPTRVATIWPHLAAAAYCAALVWVYWARPGG
jgi:hypothetical protein